MLIASLWCTVSFEWLLMLIVIYYNYIVCGNPIVIGLGQSMINFFGLHACILEEDLFVSVGMDWWVIGLINHLRLLSTSREEMWGNYGLADELGKLRSCIANILRRFCALLFLRMEAKTSFVKIEYCWK